MTFVVSPSHDTGRRSQAPKRETFCRFFRAPWSPRYGSVFGRLGQVPSNQRNRIPAEPTQSHLPVLDYLKTIYCSVRDKSNT